VQRDPILEWREQYARCCLTVDFEPFPGATFSASVKPIFPELRTVRAALSAGFLFRDDNLLLDGNDSLEVSSRSLQNSILRIKDARLGLLLATRR
jgi:hypothetical protein